VANILVEGGTRQILAMKKKKFSREERFSASKGSQKKGGKRKRETVQPKD